MNRCSHKQLRFLLLLAAALLAACSGEPKLETPKQAFRTRPAYDYPIHNPFAATIIGMPPQMKVDYSSVPKPVKKTIMVFEDRKIPPGFWYQDGVQYQELLQHGPAPLVYVVAGTGADADAEDMRTMSDILYTGGFSVVLLPSPTHPNFIINASEFYLPGSPIQDSRDLYRLMRLIDARVAQEAKVTGRMLLGYSLGALDVAYTARLDDEEHVLRFSRVLLIDPPLSLYASVKIIDDYLYSALPHGIDSAPAFVKGLIARLTTVARNNDALNFSSERVLLDAYDKYKPDDRRLATTIGLSFRLAAADMILTSDIMGHYGYIFPKNREFTVGTNMDDYLAVALRTGFRDYMDEAYLPALHHMYPGMSTQRLIENSSLEPLSGYIARSGKFRLITNRDDIALGSGESARLAALFGTHATVFPNGGHLGNLGHPAVAYQILEYMRQ